MPELTREQQDAVLFPVILAVGHVDRTVCRHGNWASYPTVNTRMADLREALRLDDPALDDLIEQKKRSGRPWGPWRTATYKGREGSYNPGATSLATMESIARKYGG